MECPKCGKELERLECANPQGRIGFGVKPKLRIVYICESCSLCFDKIFTGGGEL